MMRTLSNPKTGRESPDTVSHVPECSQNQDLAFFISKKIQLVSLIGKTLKIYYLEKKQENEKYKKGNRILQQVNEATTNDELSKLHKEFEELAQQTDSSFSNKLKTKLWKAYVEATKQHQTVPNNLVDTPRPLSNATPPPKEEVIDLSISQASTPTRTSNATPPPDKEVIERATYYPVHLSTLLSDTKEITKYIGGFQNSYFESFKEALEHSSPQLEIRALLEDPIQSRVDLKNHLDKLKITYLNMKINEEQENKSENKIEGLNELIKCVGSDINKLTTFLQDCPKLITLKSIEVTSTEWIDYQLEKMKEPGLRQSICGKTSDFHKARQEAGEFNCANIDLNKLIEHTILTVLHRWTHTNCQHNSEEKKQLTNQLIQAIKCLEASTIESDTLKKAIKKVVSFHVCKVTMARIPVLTKIEVPYKKTRRNVNGNLLIEQMKKIQKHLEATSHTLYLYPEKQEIPKHEKQFSTALYDQYRIMQAIDPYFDQALWALTPTIESAKKIEISSEGNPTKIERYIEYFQRYNDIMSDIKTIHNKTLDPPEGFSEIQEKFHSTIKLEAQSLITTSIEHLNEAIKKSDTDETECFLISVSELQPQFLSLQFKYQNSVDKPHCDLIQIIQHLESFKRHGKIPEIPDGGLRDYFEIYKGIQLKKEKEALKTMIGQVVVELDSINLEIDSLLNTLPSPVIPEYQSCCFFWETKNPLHTAATELKGYVTSAKQSLINHKVEILSSPSIEALATKKQAIAGIGTTLKSKIESPEITTPLRASRWERIKALIIGLCCWLTGSSPDDTHSSPKTRLSQKHNDIMEICNNPRNTLFSRSASHHTQVTGSPTHYGYIPVPAG